MALAGNSIMLKALACVALLAVGITVVVPIRDGAQSDTGTGPNGSGAGAATVAPPSEATVGDLTWKAVWHMTEAEKRFASLKEHLDKLQETIKTWGQKVASSDDLKTARAGTAAIRSAQEGVVLAASMALSAIRSLEVEIRGSLLPRLIAAQDKWEKVKAQPGISVEYAALIQRALDKNQKNIAHFTAWAAKLKGDREAVAGLDLPRMSDAIDFGALDGCGRDFTTGPGAVDARLRTTFDQIAKILPPKT